jgi:hypothetical protein
MSLIQKFKGVYILLKKLKYWILSLQFGTKSTAIMQTASTTFMDRHPDIFDFLKLQFGDQQIRLLSFGCSTGEECFSLRNYLPNAKITGVDINPNSILTAKKNSLVDGNMEFVCLSPNALHQLGQFDVILALSVLCKNPEAQELNDISSIYPFHRYNTIVSLLDSQLNKNGYLIIRSSNFRLKDSSVFSNYSVVNFEKRRDPKDFPKFDSNNKRLKNYLETEEFFRKES